MDLHRGVERVELFHADNGHILAVKLAATLVELVVDLARAHDHPLDRPCGRNRPRERRVVQELLERPVVSSEIVLVGTRSMLLGVMIPGACGSSA
jgi:hypothetical protein